jgi:hypothetical protein
MFNDFQIGQKCSNMTRAESKYSDCCISETSREYWWYSDDFHFGGRINKSSDVGVQIKKMLASLNRRKEINDYVLQKSLASLSTRDFKRIMRRILDIQFKNGKNEKIQEIKAVLVVE